MGHRAAFNGRCWGLFSAVAGAALCAGMALAQAGCTTHFPKGTDPWNYRPERLRYVVGGSGLGLAMLYDCAFTPDGRYFLVSQLGGIVFLDGRNFQEVRRQKLPHNCQIAVSPDSKRVAYSANVQGNVDEYGRGDDVFVRNVDSWELVNHLEMPGLARTLHPSSAKAGDKGHIRRLAYSRDGRYLAVGSDLTGVTVWQMPEGRIVARNETAGTDRLYWLTATRILSSSVHAETWDITDPGRSEDLGDLICWALSPSGHWLAADRATGSGPRTYLVSLKSRETRADLVLGSSAAFPPGERCVALAHMEVRVLSVPDGRELVSLLWRWPDAQGYERLAHTQINHLHFSPDGRFLVSADNQGTVLVWDVADLTK